MRTRVLVVDDNEQLAENLAEILEDEGYDATTAFCPETALERALTSGFDVALMDVHMPGMDGVSLYGRLREHLPDATYLLMTAHTRDERLGDARRAGIGAIFPKPLPIRTLLAHLPAAGPDTPVVLVIEDEASLAASLVDLLRAEGIRAHAVGSLGAARRALAELAPGAVVCDVRPPDGDGASFASELCTGADLPIVLITGFEAQTAQAALRNDCRDHTRVLTKPFPPERLLATLQELGPRAHPSPESD